MPKNLNEKKPAKKIIKPKKEIKEKVKKEPPQSLGIDGSDRFWVFTINNYNKENVETLKKIECNLDNVVRAIQCQAEIGEKKTKHLQGFIIFNKQQRMAAVKKTLECYTVSLKRMETTEKKNLEYTSKSKTYDEDANIFIRKGVFNMVSGKRTDIASILDEIDKGKHISDILDGENRITYIQNSVGIDRYATLKKRINPKVVAKYSKIENRPWQNEFEKLLKEPADDRKIMWLADTKGNTGKTTLMHKLRVTNEKTCFCLTNFKTVDNATSNLRNWIKKGNEPEIIILNLSRSKDETGGIYDFLENIKDGYITTTRYEDEVADFIAPHVVVFSNWYPAIVNKKDGCETLTHDRWDIMRISEDGTKLEKVSVEEAIKLKEEVRHTKKVNELKTGKVTYTDEEADMADREDILNKLKEMENTIKQQAETIKQLQNSQKVEKVETKDGWPIFPKKKTQRS